MKTVILLASLMSVGLQGLASGQIKTELWTTREIAEVGLRFKLPKRYKEKRWEVTIPGTPLGRRFYADLTFVDFEIEKRTTFDHAKTHFQLEYSDFKEWTDDIRGHKALIQTFRGGGSLITGKGVSAPYRVTVVCEVDAQRFLSIRAACTSKDEQNEIAAMVQTLEFSSDAESH